MNIFWWQHNFGWQKLDTRTDILRLVKIVSSTVEFVTQVTHSDFKIWSKNLNINVCLNVWYVGEKFSVEHTFWTGLV